ncbi:hypothetical protein FRB94_012048 [Tulasnella sp. JGI-2019a]|nr:hypothetical protein FRB94_012048 [Tulasnella sp. JGI-2019a]KAG9014532.1 hypothetical protein FRB93_013657 [Tulasnella sp. JGI-2019a]KAG9039786.1 hypothetical protein FRB95_007213 [Tulasnella sp. JGI-2019a]
MYNPPSDPPPQDFTLPPGPPPRVEETAPSEPPPAYSPQTQPNQQAVEGFIDLTALSRVMGPAESIHPLDPPPECFSTSTPIRIRSHSFESFWIPSLGPNLAGGFQILYPPALFEPHGISQDDWVRFVRDLGVAARLAARGKPAIARRPGPPAILSAQRLYSSRAQTRPYDQAFVRTPLDETKALIEVWNESAFERRKLRVSLHAKQGGYQLLVEAL